MGPRTLATRAGIGLVVAALLAAADCARTAPRIVLVTTTSVGNSGLLEELLPAYERASNVQFGVHLVGSGLALKMLAEGQGDVAIGHAPEAETEALREHPRWWYRKIMFDDFLIVGPSVDAARVRGAQDAADAFRRIASAGSEFVSRADQSGTHERTDAEASDRTMAS
jgi:tungstate transport system substrate-binding protein